MTTRHEPVIRFILSGGIGTRLWPLSREDLPKQFHSVAGSGSMLADTIRRMSGRRGDASDPVHLIASRRHAERIGAERAGTDLGGGRALFEPVGRNTAAAIALAAEVTLREHGDRLVLVAPSDHAISTDRDFWNTIEAGIAPALNGRIVLFGIRPERPETGFGYVETGGGPETVHDVVRFIEKPDRTTAARFIDAGTFFWNAGIFLFRAGVMRDAFRRLAPDIGEGVAAALDAATTDAAGTWLPRDPYATIPSASVDTAIMEREAGIALVPATFRWHDLGSWQALRDAGPADKDGNVIVGDVIADGCRRSYLRSDGGLLTAVDLNDMAVVATSDAVFVAPLAANHAVCRVVSQLEDAGRRETRITPVPVVPTPGAWRGRVGFWLFEEALPVWSNLAVDDRQGGFFDTPTAAGLPPALPKRMRSMARHIQAFAAARQAGFQGPTDQLIERGLRFIAGGRTADGGWARSLHAEGGIADRREDLSDQAIVLQALAEALKAGHREALQLGRETLAFIEARFGPDPTAVAADASGEAGARRSDPALHLLEGVLAWHAATGDHACLDRAGAIAGLFADRFFDPETWTLRDPAGGGGAVVASDRAEPGRQFAWAALLADAAAAADLPESLRLARKLHTTATANGLNPTTGLAYAALSPDGRPLDANADCRSQAAAVAAAIALDREDGPELRPEIEARIGRLFRWHLDPAPRGLWIDRLDREGRPQAGRLSADTFCRLVSVLARYLGAAPIRHG